MKNYRIPVKNYSNAVDCLKEVNSLKQNSDCFVVGLPYITKRKAAFTPEPRGIKCKYRMDWDEDRCFDFNRLDRANNFSFRFLSEGRMYCVSNESWAIRRVASMGGVFSQDEPWNLEWVIRGFTRGQFSNDKNLKTYFRYVTLLKKNNSFFTAFERFPKSVILSYPLLDSTRIKIGDVNFDVYSVSFKGNTYLCIDNCSAIDIERFDESVMAILFGTGFVNQYIVLDEAYTFQVDSPCSGKPLAMRYRSLRESIEGQYSIFTTNAFSVRVPLGNIYGFDPFPYISIWSARLLSVPASVMDALCGMLYKYPNLINVVTILVDASRSGLEIQGASLAVALETLTHEISTNKIVPLAKVKPVVEKAKFKGLRDCLKNVVDISTLTDVEKKFLKDKIDNLNQPTNRDKLQLPFPALGIHVTKAMIDVIDQRNTFLHGKYKFSMKDDDLDRLVWICKALHQLCCILLFKLAGFSGYIIDQTAFDPKIGSITGCNKGFIWI